MTITKSALILMGVVATNFGANSSWATTYQCTGKYETQGKLTLTVNGSKITLRGSYESTDPDGTKKAKSMNCTAEASNKHPTANKNYDYFDPIGRCSVDFVGISSSLSRAGKGVLKLVDKNGGEWDQMPTYGYEYFSCKR